ncbi:asparagine synthase (glutamine-hydrolyzing) [bacterium]|nr:asparagine synthase (glutamine-hydrolyzing) [bacterium]
MCGSAAWLPDTLSQENLDRFSTALQTLARRGPEATELTSTDRGLVGHCRLALRDAEGGRQPWKMSDGRWLAFVGEIYNCHSLRNLLLVHGAKLETASDTEIVAKSIELWGARAYEKYNGMFAITILDPKTESLELARDRHGLKPLYFTVEQQSAAASSESRALVDLSNGHVADQFALLHLLQTSQLALAGQTLWAGISLLPPGGMAKLTRSEKVENVYVSNEIEEERTLRNVGNASAKIRSLLEEAVHLQQQADYPVGVFLSGGLDSSIVAAILAQQSKSAIETFAVALEGEANDLDAARQVSRFIRSHHSELIVNTDEFFVAMRELIALRGVPVVLPNEVLIYLLSLQARKSVKAVLSGEGADELFGGYHKLAARLAGAERNATSFADDYRNATAWFSHDDLRSVLRNREALHIYEQRSRDFIRSQLTREASRARMLRRTLKRDHLPHLLLRLDGASMASSLEARAPFTDNALVEFVETLDDSMIAPRFGLDKPLLRDAASGVLPENLLKRPKRAFHASLPNLLDSVSGKRELQNALSQPLIQKLFLIENLNKLLNDESRTPIRHKNWLICSLGMWAEIHRVTETN